MDPFFISKFNIQTRIYYLIVIFIYVHNQWVELIIEQLNINLIIALSRFTDNSLGLELLFFRHFGSIKPRNNREDK